MQTLRSVYVSKAEWRWVIILSGLLVALTLVPYAWASIQNEGEEDWHFMGMLTNPKDGAAYLSQIEQGRQGSWLFELRHSPEAHDGAGFHTFYLFLGHTARITGLSNLVIFHLTRLATSLFMYISLYQFGATVWVRLRPRRIFFTLVALGSGLGWLLLVFNTEAIAADLVIPETFPFFSSLANPHFPFSIACLALVASTFMVVFRRGYTAEPSVENGGLGLILLSMLLALNQPTALVPIGGALVLYVIIRAYLTREFPVHELRWASMLWLPAIPFVIYSLAVFRFNDEMAIFLEQDHSPSPPVYSYIFGYGLLLLTAIPGLARAVRRFERDGDQFMLLWFVVNVIGLYSPFSLQRRLNMGLVIPLVFFAVRAIEDYWFYKIPRQWRAPVLVTLIVFIIPSNILNIFIPLVSVIKPDVGLETGVVLQSDYWHALQWLKDEGEEDAVVLASPNVSLWVPGNTQQVVVYGHPLETVHVDERLEQVENWYHGTDCTTLLSDSIPFRVKYILWGPQERDFSEEDAKEIKIQRLLDDVNAGLVRSIQVTDDGHVTALYHNNALRTAQIDVQNSDPVGELRTLGFESEVLENHGISIEVLRTNEQGLGAPGWTCMDEIPPDRIQQEVILGAVRIVILN